MTDFLFKQMCMLTQMYHSVGWVFLVATVCMFYLGWVHTFVMVKFVHPCGGYVHIYGGLCTLINVLMKA
jgi:hypothetical protein